MEEMVLKSSIKVAQMTDLSPKEQELVQAAIKATYRSYAVYSNFHVGAAVLLDNGETIMGSNQENVSFGAGICAERTALFAAGTQFPEVPIQMIAIAARKPDGNLQESPISPCGICRQAILEVEKRYHKPVRIILYGTDKIYVVEGIQQLMPLSFTDF